MDVWPGGGCNSDGNRVSSQEQKRPWSRTSQRESPARDPLCLISFADTNFSPLLLGSV